MDLTNFILLAVERNMISNKYGLDLFYTVFKEASRNQPTSGKDGQFETSGSSSVLINHNFFRAITMLAKTLYAHEQRPFESMFNKLLVDQIRTADSRMVGGRQPKLGEDTMEILSEDAIRVYLLYYEQLKTLFTQFIHSNFNAKKKVVGWHHIEDQNQLLYVSAFLKLARCNSIINDMLNIETLHDFIEQVIPPITQKEKEFLEKDRKLLQIYHSDKKPNETTCDPEDGEPGLLFHEFIFLLGLIALHAMDHVPETCKIIEDFFIEKLNFKRETEIPQYVYPEDRDDEEYDEEFESDGELEMDEQQKAFMAFLEKKQYEDDNFTVDFDEILQVMDADLPMVPGIPTVVPFPNPLENKDKEAPIRVTFGKLYPKEKKSKDDAKKKGAAKKPAPKKKDEKPPKPILWEAEKGPQPATTLDLMRQTQADLEQNTFPMNIRQESCNTGVMPTIIKEVFMPPEAPSTVATLIESSLVYQNSANYEMAVHSLEQARDEWRRLISPPQKDEKKDTNPTPQKSQKAPEAPK